MIDCIRLTVDLSAIVHNWQSLADMAPGAECAAVVKADAYGLGMDRVARALFDAGCRSFFVAHVQEGIDLRRLLPSPRIFILNGIARDDLETSRHAGLIPVVNTPAELDAVVNHARDSAPIPIALHVDTGLNRLGLTEGELARLVEDRDRLLDLRIELIFSHLVAAEHPAHPANPLQLERFRTAVARLPPAPLSLANSSGVFLGCDYHFDMVRPGACLYGVNPTPDRPNSMRGVVKLEAQVLKIAEIAAGNTVGYGGDFTASRPTRLATLSIGYADGLRRTLARNGFAYAAGVRCPFAGRISMDLSTVDITGIEPGQLVEGAFMELIGPHCPVDRMAGKAGTIGYELLTGLGKRGVRVYETAIN